MRRSLASCCLLALALLPSRTVRSDEPAPSPDKGNPVAIELFEKEIRPILANRCLQCHGEAKQKGGLRLDSRKSTLTGGNSGPAIVPGKPAESLLVDAINHGDLVQMPPKSKLSASEIQSLTTWVKDGATWGYESSLPKTVEAAAENPRDLKGPSEVVKKRGGFWSFQQIRDSEPPFAYHDQPHWARNGMDRFILDAMRKKGLKPASEAGKRALIRRLTFDLTGLPPMPTDVDAFLADNSTEAYEKVVERLLASPRYGERWARHWLDLARYADTAGHEFDYDLLNAYRYRDYVVRALNADLPYDRFITEQIAGDLLEKPRRHPSSGLNESILGTGFFFLGEGTHSPVDVREEEVRRMDNQIDVFSKTFLGLTVGCARCHDHKFDPITARDYYALAGYMKSTRHQQAFLDDPDRLGEKARQLSDGKETIRKLLVEALPSLAADLRTKLMGVIGREDRRVSVPGPASGSAEIADKPVAGAPIVFESFGAKGFDSWQASGEAFGQSPTGLGEFRLECLPKDQAIAGWRLRPVRPGLAHSGLLSEEFHGVLRSRSFRIDRRFIHILASGRHGRINIPVDRFDKLRDPIYGSLTIRVDGDRPDEPRWITRNLSMWTGHSAYVELADGSAADFAASQTRSNRGDGFLTVGQIVLSDQETPPPLPAVSSPPALSLGPILATLEHANSPLYDRLTSALADYRSASAEIPSPTFGLAMVDGSAEDERVLIRGNHKNPGATVPRRILEVLGGLDLPATPAGSGRLELAARLVDPRNPLVSRVMVNRIWQHHFGSGLVKSADDFGAMGQQPSHPELLDWLAKRFVEQGWSIKAMHRLMVTSSTYRMASVPDPEADRIDPTNTYLHRMNVRRLEAEVIRDSLLAVTSGLDETMFGSPIPVHLTSFMEGRGRPAGSGPLDGKSRRSIYLGVRRNFLNPMFLAFDAPAPFSTMGRRNISNVPAQALTLLNDPLILAQARRWAERILAEPNTSASGRIERLYESAFGRAPTPAEASASLSFLAQVENAPSAAGKESTPGDRSLRAWTDLCHVMINVKEFIYVE